MNREIKIKHIMTDKGLEELPTQPQSWEEEFENLIPNSFFRVLNSLDCIVKREEIKQFIQSLLSENTDDILRKFATGDFIKTPLAKKFEKQIRRDIIKGIEKIRDAVAKRHGTDKYSSCYDDCIKLIKGL